MLRRVTKEERKIGLGVITRDEIEYLLPIIKEYNKLYDGHREIEMESFGGNDSDDLRNDALRKYLIWLSVEGKMSARQIQSHYESGIRQLKKGGRKP